METTYAGSAFPALGALQFSGKYCCKTRDIFRILSPSKICYILTLPRSSLIAKWKFQVSCVLSKWLPSPTSSPDSHLPSLTLSGSFHGLFQSMKLCMPLSNRRAAKVTDTEWCPLSCWCWPGEHIWLALAFELFEDIPNWCLSSMYGEKKF